MKKATLVRAVRDYLDAQEAHGYRDGGVGSATVQKCSIRRERVRLLIQAYHEDKGRKKPKASGDQGTPVRDALRAVPNETYYIPDPNRPGGVITVVSRKLYRKTVGNLISQNEALEAELARVVVEHLKAKEQRPAPLVIARAKEFVEVLERTAPEGQKALRDLKRALGQET